MIVLDRGDNMGDGNRDSILDRLHRLERQNRFQRRAGFVLAIAVAASFLMGQATVPKAVVSESFVLKDSGGNNRAALNLDSAGVVQLALAGRNEKIFARLSVASNGTARLALTDNMGIVRAGLSLLQDGTPDFGLADSAGVVRIGVGFDKKDNSPALVFYEPSGAVSRRLP
jgi:hypothetical protein